MDPLVESSQKDDDLEDGELTDDDEEENGESSFGSSDKENNSHINGIIEHDDRLEQRYKDERRVSTLKEIKQGRAVVSKVDLDWDAVAGGRQNNRDDLRYREGKQNQEALAGENSMKETERR